MKVLNTYIEENILTALKLSKNFVILADECQDESGREQLAIFVRYIIESSCEVREDYKALVNLNDAEDKLESRTAKGLMESISALFEEKNISIDQRPSRSNTQRYACMLKSS